MKWHRDAVKFNEKGFYESRTKELWPETKELFEKLKAKGIDVRKTREMSDEELLVMIELSSPRTLLSIVRDRDRMLFKIREMYHDIVSED